MLRTRHRAALLVAVLLALATSTSGAPIAAAGPPLRYLGGVPGTLDPAFIADANDVQLLLQLYAGLTRLDEIGTPYPSLAQGWSVSDDGLTYTFTLRAGLEFSDGQGLDAEDVRRSWLRMLDPATGSTAPDVLSVIVGASERLAGSAVEDEVGIAAPDARTLTVTLRHPAAYFPAITATPATFVVPPAADASNTWQTPDGFVGSGPYVVDGGEGPDLILRANPSYVAGPPPIEEVRWVAGLETDSVGAFAAGEIDLAGVAGWDATWLAYDPELGQRLHRAEPLTVSYMGFDTTRPPFDDARVRRAFALALDRTSLVPLSVGAVTEPASSLVPPAARPDGFGGGSLDADPDEARRLLDEAGFAERSELGTIVVNGSAIDVGPAVATWREELDVEIAVEAMESDAYFAALATDTPHVFSVTWIADYPSPDALYSLLLQPAAASNYGRWSDPEFVELLEVAAAAQDDAAQVDAYRDVEARVVDQAPVIPWSYDDTWWLVADGLRGLGNLTVGLLDLGRVSWDG